MPNKTLSILDYISIAERRLRGESQEQVAKTFEVSTSLIGKLEKHNPIYRQIQKDLLASVVDERGRNIAYNTPAAQILAKEMEALKKALPTPAADFQRILAKEMEALKKALPTPAADFQRILDEQRKMLADMTPTVDIQKYLDAQQQGLAGMNPTADLREFLDAQRQALADAINSADFKQIQKMQAEFERAIADFAKIAPAQVNEVRQAYKKAVEDLREGDSAICFP